MATKKDFMIYKAMLQAGEPNALRWGIEKGISVAKLRNPFDERWN